MKDFINKVYDDLIVGWYWFRWLFDGFHLVKVNSISREEIYDFKFILFLWRLSSDVNVSGI